MLALLFAATLIMIVVVIFIFYSTERSVDRLVSETRTQLKFNLDSFKNAVIPA